MHKTSVVLLALALVWLQIPGSQGAEIRSYSHTTRDPVTIVVKDENDVSYTIQLAVTTTNPSGVTEGQPPNNVPISFLITQTSGTAPAYTLEFDITGTGVDSNDYTLTSGVTSLPFTGAPSFTVTVPVSITADLVGEDHETLLFRVTKLSIGTFPNDLTSAGLSASVLIRNDDPLFTFAYTPSFYEGFVNSPAMITITSVYPTYSSFTLTVSLSGLADPTADFIYSGGYSFFFNAVGGGSAIMNFAIVGDGIFEADEDIKVSLDKVTFTTTNSPNSLDYYPNQDATMIIQNDDPNLKVTFNPTGQPEGNAGDSATVTLSIKNNVPTTIPSFTLTIDVRGRSASVDSSDYSYAISTPLEFTSAGQQIDIQFTIKGDDAVEIDEYIDVQLLTASFVGGTIDVSSFPDSIADYEIQNDDVGLSLTLDTAQSLQVVEGDTVNTVLQFTLTPLGDVPYGFTADYSFTSTTADGSDYTVSGLAASPISFSGLSTDVKTFTVTIIADTAPEDSDNIVISFPTLHAPAYDYSTSAQLTVQILNDDTQITISGSLGTYLEGSISDQTVQLQVKSSKAVYSPFTVLLDPSVTGGLTTPEDYEIDILSVSFDGLADEIKIVTVTIKADTIPELDGTVTVTLYRLTFTAIGGATVSLSGSQSVTIQDDDPQITFSVDTDKFEGNGVTSQLIQFTVEIDVLSNSGSIPAFTLEFDVTTLADNDDFSYVPSSPLSFTGVAQTKTIDVTIKPDTTVEPDEAITITLTKLIYTSTLEQLDLTVPSQTFTILNDDLTIILGSTANQEWEKNSALEVRVISFEVLIIGTLSVPFDLIFTSVGTCQNDGVDCLFNDGTNPLSYTTAPYPSKQLSVTVYGDTQVEPNESVTYTLQSYITSTFNVLIAGQSQTLVILNDDTTFHLSEPTLPAGGISEGFDSTSTPITYTISYDDAIGGPFTVTVTPQSGLPNQADGSDYTAPASVSFPLSPTASSKTFVVTVNGDLDIEPDETIFLQLTSVEYDGWGSSVPLSVTNANYKILNDDTSFIITPNTAPRETSTGSPVSWTFNVKPTFTTNGEGFQVAYSVAGSGANPATGIDFTVVSPATLVFDGSSTSAIPIQVNVAGDTDVEPDEGFTVTLTQVTYDYGGSYDPGIKGSTLVSPVDATIFNDDTSFSVSFAGTEQWEGKSGDSTLVTATIKAMQPIAGGPYIVRFTLGGTADQLTDYTPPGSLEVTFSGAAADLEQTVQFTVKGDADEEADETLILALEKLIYQSGSGEEVLIASTSATLTILNDDTTIGINVKSGFATVLEGFTGETPSIEFLISSTAAVLHDFDVTYAISGSSGLDSSDYQPVTGRVTFSPGSSASETLVINIEGDIAEELDETLTVELTSIEFSSGGPTYMFSSGALQASSTILNDDSGITISASASQILEGSDGTTTPMTFTILSHVPTNGVGYSVSFSITGASDSADYDQSSSTPSPIHFDGTAADLSKTLTIYVKADMVPEASVTLKVNLDKFIYDVTLNEYALTGSAETIIENDDTTVTISPADDEQYEGVDGTSYQVRFTISISPTLTRACQVHYAITTDPSVDADDAVLPAVVSTVTIAASDSTAFIDLTIKGDFSLEDNESIIVSLTLIEVGSSSTLLSGITGQFTILNDDTYISLTPVTNLLEGTNRASAVPLLPQSTVDFTLTSSTYIQGGFLLECDLTGTMTESDYIGSSRRGVTYVGGASEQGHIVVTIVDDALPESDETLTLNVNDCEVQVWGTDPYVPSAGLGTSSTTATVQNDDTYVSITAPIQSQVLEGSDATTTAITFTVEITDFVNGAGFTVQYLVQGATDPEDYDLALSSSVSFSGNGAVPDAQLLTIQINADTIIESDVPFTVALQTLTYTADGEVVDLVTRGGPTLLTASATILDDDTVVSISGTQSVREGTSGSTQITFRVSVTVTLPAAFDVIFSVSGDASSGSDYDIPFVNTVSFSPSDQGIDVTVNIHGDPDVESDEFLVITLVSLEIGGDSYAIPAGNFITITIQNDDTYLSVVALAPAQVAEGTNNALTPEVLVFEVTSSAATVVKFDVSFSFSGLANTMDSDYSANPVSVLNFDGLQGETQTITITIQGDDLPEDNEDVIVTLTTVTLVGIIPTEAYSPTVDPLNVGGLLVASGLILNDDTSLQLIAADSLLVRETTTQTSTVTMKVTSTLSLPGVYWVYFSITPDTDEGTDFDVSPALGYVEFQPGDLEQSIVVTVYGDDIEEIDQNIVIALTQFEYVPTGDVEMLGAPSQTLTVTIVNDDTTISISGQPTGPITEGSFGTQTISLTFTSSSHVPGGFELIYSLLSSSADAGDFSVSGQLLFDGLSDGETKTLDFIINGDVEVEGDEIIDLRLSRLEYASINDPWLSITGQAVISIPNDDTTISFSGSPSPDIFNEGEQGASRPLVFTIRSSESIPDSFKIYWSIIGDVDAADYVVQGSSGPLLFSGAPGQTQTINLDVKGDYDPEIDELLTVSLDRLEYGNGGGYYFSTGNGSPTRAPTTLSASVTLLNDDTTLTIVSVTGAQTFYEGTTGSTRTSVIQVRSSDLVPSGFTVDFDFDASTASEADLDYSLNVPLLTFDGNPNEDQFLTVTFNGDFDVDPDETLMIWLNMFTLRDGSQPPYSLQPDPSLQVSYTIINDDVLLTIQAQNDPVVEGTSGTKTITFKVVAGGPAINTDFSVSFTDSILPAGINDYSVVGSNLLTFDGNVDNEEEVIQILINGDTTIESDEVITITLTFLNYLTEGGIETLAISDDTTIQNDDTSISISGPSPVSMFEGNSGPRTVTWTVTSTDATAVDFDVSFTVVGGAVNGVAAGDYTAGSTIHFNGLLNEQVTLSVDIVGDLTVEPDETLVIQLQDLIYDVSNFYTLPSTLSTPELVITNDDTSFSIAINPPTNPVEGSPTSSQTILFEVTSSATVGQLFTVAFSFSASTATPGLGQDFVINTVSPLMFSGNGPETLNVEIVVMGDLLIEGSEIVQLDLTTVTLPSTGTSYNLGLSSILTILDDDTTISIVALNPQTIEKNSGSTVLTWEVTSSDPTALGFTIDFEVLTGAGKVDSSDFNNPNPATMFVTFVGNQVNEKQLIKFNLLGDNTIEPDEDMTVRMTDLTYTNSDQYTLPNPTEATAVIWNDDTNLSITAAQPTVIEGNQVPRNKVTFTITSTNAVHQQFTVLLVEDSSSAAKITSDYTLVAGTIPFDGNLDNEMQTFDVTMVEDLVPEPDEILLLNMDSAAFTVTGTFQNYVGFVTPSASTTILNDDTTFTITTIPSTGVVREDNPPNTTPASFVVTSNWNVAEAFTVDFSFGGSADGSDFSLLSPALPSLPFAAAAGSSQVDILVIGDFDIEDPDQTVILQLDQVNFSDPSSASYSPAPAVTQTITIQDDDTTISIAADQPTQIEYNSGFTKISFTVTSTDAVPGGFSIIVSVGGVDIDGTDYDTVTPLNFAGTDGEQQKLYINILGDENIEDDEQLTVTLTMLVYNGGLGSYPISGSAVTTILNDDTQIGISASVPSIIEGNNAPNRQATFTIVSSNIVHQSFTVSFSTSGAADGLGADYSLNPLAVVSFNGLTANEPQDITVTIIADFDPELDEDIVVTIETVAFSTTGTFTSYAGVTTASDSILIRNDDTTFTISVTPNQAAEGSPSESTPVSFLVTSVWAVAEAFTVDFTLSGTAISVGGLTDDYSGATVGPLTFDGNVNEPESVSFNVLGDLTVEPDESVILTLGQVSFPSSGSYTPSPAVSETYFIQNDDSTFTVVASQASIIEGTSGNQPVHFDVTSEVDSADAFTLTCSIVGAGIDSADYDNVVPATLVLTFNGPAETQTVTLDIVGDTDVESDEPLTLRVDTITYLSSSLSFSVTGVDDAITIQNDDTVISFAGTVTVVEGANPSTQLVSLTITSSEYTNGAEFDVLYNVAGTALTSDNDYVLITGASVHFTGTLGETHDIIFSIVGDTTPEPDDTIIVTLTSVSYSNAPAGSYTLSVAAQTITIQNDDTLLTFTGGVTILEKAYGSQTVTLTITSSTNVVGGFEIEFSNTGLDYSISTSSPVPFAGTAGESWPINVVVDGDLIIEPDDTITVSLDTITIISSGISYSLTGLSQSVIVQNDDVTITVDLGVASPLSITERSSSSQPFSATIASSPSIPTTFTVEFLVIYLVGDDGSDYVLSTTTNPIPFTGVSTDTRNVLFSINGDTTVESDETLSIRLTTVTYANGEFYLLPTTTQVDVVIPNDDTTLVISGFPLAPVPELSLSFDTTLILTVTSQVAIPYSFMVHYTLTGSGDEGTDYTIDLHPSPLSFTGPVESVDIHLTITGDNNVESDENVILTLTTFEYTAGDSYSLTQTAQLVIQNDDTTFTLTAPTNPVEDDTTIQMMIQSSTLTNSGFSLTYGFVGSTASSPADYAPTPAGSIHFAGTPETKLVDYTIYEDLVVEIDETIKITLLSVVYDPPRTDFIDLTSLALTATVTIVDDDTCKISITPSSLAIAEGTPSVAPAGVFTFTVLATLETAEPYSVDFLIDLSSLAVLTPTADYSVSRTSPILFNGAAGENYDIVINALPDFFVELDENVIINLVSINSASSLDIQIETTQASAEAEILNDDQAFVSISSPSMAESDSGVAQIIFRVSVDYADPFETCNFALRVDDNTAVSPSDYTNPGTIVDSLAPGELFKDFTINVNGDYAVEYDETFYVTIIYFDCNGRGGIANGLGIGEIRNDDQAVISVFCTPCSGNEDTASPAVFHVKSTNPIDVPFVTVDVTITPGTAQFGVDYIPSTITSVQFDLTNTDFLVNSVINSDPLFENDETFTVTISGLTTVGSPPAPGLNVIYGQTSATYTILNDDTAQIVLTSPPAIIEGNSGTTSVVFSLWFNAASGQPVELDYQTTDGSATVSDADYINTSGTVSFAGVLPEETKTVVVNIRGDYKGESDELFGLSAIALRKGTLTYPISLTNWPGSATISNDDTVKISISNAEAFEGTLTPNSLVFTITADYQSAVPYTVSATVSSGSASHGIDFTGPLTQNFNFVGSAGESFTFSLVTVADSDAEVDESFTVTLAIVTTGVPYLAVGTATGQGTIKNDDSTSVRVADCTATEGLTCDFVISISEDISPAVDIYYITNNLGTAQDPSDFTAVSGHVTLGDLALGGSLTATVTVATNPDSVGERDEFFYFKIGDVGVSRNVERALPSSVIIADNQAIGTIQNNDPFTISLNIRDNQVNTEGAFGTTYDVIFELQITGTLDTDITVDFVISGGTATAGSDFVDPATVQVLIPQGQTTFDIYSVTVNGDDLVEAPSETFIGVIQNVQSAGRTVTVAQASAMATITEDDTATFTVQPISKNEGSVGLVFFQFDFILQQDVDSAFSFDYVTTDGSATILDDDYNAASGTLAFAGVKNEARHIFVQINTDTKVEDNEDFSFVFSNENFNGRAHTLPAPPVGTLLNDDSSTVYVMDGSITEGDSGTNAFVLWAISTNEVDLPFTVQYTINPGTALPSPDDYSAPYSGLLSFSGAAAGEQLAITVNVIGDTVVEPTQESFTVSLGSLNVALARSIVLSGTDGVGTILDNDSAEVSIDDATADESDPVISFKVNLSAQLPADLTLTWNQVHITTQDYDFDGTPPLTGTVTITAGSTFAFIDIDINDDNLVEPTKTFRVVLTPPAITRVSITDGNALGTLTDDDTTTLVFTYDATIGDNGDEDTVGNAVFQVSLSPNDVEIPVQFDFTVVDGTAIVSDGDYNTYAGTFTVSLAGVPVDLPVPVNVDTRVEPDETFDGQISNFQLSGQQVTVPGTSSLTFTINNDDEAMVNIVAATATRNEGNSGSTNFLWVVRLDFSTSGPVEVDYQTVDGAATVADLDYQPATGTVVFTGTGTNELRPIIIQALGDLVGESDEDFAVQLIALRAPGMIAGTVDFDPLAKSAQIINDDFISVTISDASTVEGNAGTKLLSFTINVSGPVATSFSLSVAAAGFGANQATGGADFTFGGASITVPAGLSASSYTVSVQVLGDTTVEADEQFVLTVTSSNLPAYVTITDAQGVGTIQNDDGISVSITDCSATEGSNCVATVSITADIVPAFTLQLSTLTGTAVAGPDFTDLTTLAVTLGGGVLSVDVPVALSADGLNELTETFTLTLSGALPSGVTAARLSSTGTITDNDPVTLSLTVTGPVTEGNSGSVPMTFTITPSGPTDVAVTFDFRTTDVTAQAGTDYTATVGTYTIPANSAASIPITVPILGDDIVESNSETFTGSISNVQSVGRSVTISNSAVLGTILDNDQALLNLVACSNVEGNLGTSFVQMTVELTNTVDSQISIGWSTQDGSAMIGDSDYLAASGTLILSGTAGNYYITLSYLGDFKVEPNEQFFVNLNSGSLIANGRNVVVNQGTGQATIVNDDSATLTVGDVTRFEGSSAGLYTVYAFPVTLSAPRPGLTVSWSIDTAASTATAVQDYVNGGGLLQFTATSGAEIQYINVQVVQDEKVEALETVVVTITDPGVTNIAVADATGLGRIVNDDSATFSVGDISRLESAGPFNVPITLSAQVDQSIDILVTVSDLTSDSGDYTAFTNPDTVTFLGTAGEVKTFTIPISNDNLVELTESMSLSISIVSNPHPLFISLADDSATVTIQNDDSTTVNIVPVAGSVIEDDPPTSVAYGFEVSLSNPVDVPITVTINAADLSATQFVDYSSPNPTSMVVSTVGPFAVNVDVLPDLSVELDEQFQLTVSVSNTQGRSVLAGSTPAIGVIVDNDDATVSFSYSASVAETDSTWVMVVQAVLSSNVDGTVRFDYVTKDLTAQIADSDYASAAGSVVFAGTAGEIKTISLVIYGDTKVEQNESFQLEVSNLQSSGRPVSFSGPQLLTLTLTNDDQSLVSVVAPVVHLEGSGANTDFVFTIQNSNAIDVGFALTYAVSDDTALAGVDYFSNTGLVAFTGFAGESKTVTIVVRGDFEVEGNEQFNFDISAIAVNGGLTRNVVIGTGTRIGGIVNDDSATVTINDQSGNESSDLVFTVRLSNLVDEDVLIAYQVDDITTSGVDWSYPVGQPNPITISVGMTSGTITVHAEFDGEDEPTEYFNLRLLSATTASGRSVSLLDFLGAGTIFDQNSAAISISDILLQPELSGTTHQVTFAVTLSGNVQGGFVVSYETDDLLARAGTDYLPASGFLSFTGFNNEMHPIAITIIEDSVVELDEAFRVVLSDLVPNNPPRDVTISKSIGLCDIMNDDISEIRINDVVANEGNSGTSNFDFTVSSTLAVDVGYTVPYTVTSASNNGDLYLTSGQVNFVGAASENQRIRVQVYGDVLVEADEQFSVTIGPLSAGGRSVVIADTVGSGTIKNDDSAVVSVNDATAWEVDMVITFTVTVTSAVDGGFTVFATTVDGTAKDGIDFNAPATISASFTGLAGETQQISIPLLDSLACETTKSFTLQLTSVVPNIPAIASSSLTISTTKGSATGTINDDDIGNPVDDLYFGATGTTLTVPAPGVLSNDPCTAGTVQLVTNTHLGVLTLNPDGSFSYDSTDCFDDVDFFEYRIVFANGQVSAKAKVTLVTSPCQSPYAILYVFTPISWSPADILGETSLVFTARDVNTGRLLETKTLGTADLNRGYYLYKPYGSVPGSNQIFTLAKGSNGAPVTPSPSSVTMLLANSVQAQDFCC